MHGGAHRTFATGNATISKGNERPSARGLSAAAGRCPRNVDAARAIVAESAQVPERKPSCGLLACRAPMAKHSSLL